MDKCTSCVFPFICVCKQWMFWRGTSPELALVPYAIYFFYSNGHAQTRGWTFMYRPNDNGLVRTEYIIVKFSYHWMTQVEKGLNYHVTSKVKISQYIASLKGTATLKSELTNMKRKSLPNYAICRKLVKIKWKIRKIQLFVLNILENYGVQPVLCCVTSLYHNQSCINRITSSMLFSIFIDSLVENNWIWKKKRMHSLQWNCFLLALSWQAVKMAL